MFVSYFERRSRGKVSIVDLCAAIQRASLFCFSICLFALANAAAAADATKFFDSTVGDFRHELAEAKKQNKQAILFMFEMDDCPYCKRMRETVLNQPEVQDYFHRHFLIFTIDVRGDLPVQDFKGNETTEKEFARSLRVRGTPTFVFVDLDGNPVATYVGATRDTGEFMTLGRYVAEGHYRKRKFEDYKVTAG